MKCTPCSIGYNYLCAIIDPIMQPKKNTINYSLGCLIKLKVEKLRCFNRFVLLPSKNPGNQKNRAYVLFVSNVLWMKPIN